MKLKISASIRNEWQVRGITDVIPSLENYPYETASVLDVDEQTAKEIAEDCKFYLDPDGPETSVGERSAYRALLKQITMK